MARIARVLPVAALLVAALPLYAQSTRENCTRIPIDTMQFGRSPIFRDCEVDKPARRTKQPGLSFTFPSSLHCAIADLEFIVAADGTPVAETARVLTTNEPRFGTSLLKSLPKWRYIPAQRGDSAVAQLVQEHVALSDGKVPFVAGRSPSRLDELPPCR